MTDPPASVTARCDIVLSATGDANPKFTQKNWIAGSEALGIWV
jgi:hypothetical protein